jgi:hypothetical protein
MQRGRFARSLVISRVQGCGISVSGLAAALVLALAGAAHAAPRNDRDATSVQFAEGDTALLPGNARIGCTIVDPARVPGWQPRAAIDRPVCARPAAPASRELWHIQRDDLAMSLRFAGGTQRGLGLLRGLMSYDHGFDLGALRSWHFHAEAQLGAASTPQPDMPIEERARFALSPPVCAGWQTRFEAGGVARGIFDPATAPQQHLEFAAQASRSFTLAPLGRRHSISLRIASEDEQDLIAGTDLQTTRAQLRYSHRLAFGAINATAEVARSAPAFATTTTATRLALSFAGRF